jgi:hypothetical protein
MTPNSPDFYPLVESQSRQWLMPAILAKPRAVKMPFQAAPDDR